MLLKLLDVDERSAARSAWILQGPSRLLQIPAGCAIFRGDGLRPEKETEHI